MTTQLSDLNDGDWVRVRYGQMEVSGPVLVQMGLKGIAVVPGLSMVDLAETMFHVHGEILEHRPARVAPVVGEMLTERTEVTPGLAIRSSTRMAYAIAVSRGGRPWRMTGGSIPFGISDLPAEFGPWEIVRVPTTGETA